MSGGLLVTCVRPGLVVEEYNHRCGLTYKNDELRRGDLIVAVNGTVSDTQTMCRELADATDIKLIVLRPHLDEPPAAMARPPR